MKLSGPYQLERAGAQQKGWPSQYEFPSVPGPDPFSHLLCSGSLFLKGVEPELSSDELSCSCWTLLSPSVVLVREERAVLI